MLQLGKIQMWYSVFIESISHNSMVQYYDLWPAMVWYGTLNLKINGIGSSSSNYLFWHLDENRWVLLELQQTFVWLTRCHTSTWPLDYMILIMVSFCSRHIDWRSTLSMEGRVHADHLMSPSVSCYLSRHPSFSWIIVAAIQNCGCWNYADTLYMKWVLFLKLAWDDFITLAHLLRIYMLHD